MVAKNTSYGSETYKPYLDIGRIINVQSADSVNRGHDTNKIRRRITVDIQKIASPIWNI